MRLAHSRLDLLEFAQGSKRRHRKRVAGREHNLLYLARKSAHDVSTRVATHQIPKVRNLTDGVLRRELSNLVALHVGLQALVRNASKVQVGTHENAHLFASHFIKRELE